MAADSRRYHPLNAQLDIGQILLEAQNRWLRPNEVCEILRNYQKFNLTPDPPYRPQGGSLFLFDRKALRYFRKDGHNWRKKKDGKTVREAHEKLKAGSIDVLHCYYAHGEENENFQRRSYWMLEGDLEHIVLVHYREVKEGTRSGVSRSTGTESARHISLTGTNTSPACSAHANSTSQTAYTSSPSTADWNGQSNSPEYEDVDSGDEASASVPPKNIFPGLPSELQENHETSKEASATSESLLQPYSSGFMDTAQLGDVSSDPFHSNMLLPESHLPSHHHMVNSSAQHRGITDIHPNHVASQLFSGSSTQHDFSSFSWPAVCRTDRVDDDTTQRISLNQSNNAADVNRNFVTSAFDGFACNQNHDIRVPAFPDAHFQAFIRNAERYIQVKGESGQSAAVHQGSLRNNQQVLEKGHMAQVHLNNNNRLSSQTSPDPHMDFYGVGTPMEVKHAGTSQDVLNDSSFNDENGGLRKLDSFGRWMSKEIGGDCDSLMASDSGNYWNALDDQNGEKEVSSLSRQMQLDVDSLGPSLSQEQLFSIIDFSPDWSYSDVEAKVLITGNFLGTGEFPGNVKWCCMFGEQEVSAEFVTNNVLRCQAPPHGPGRVPFYVTCSNRLACSEIREFEYREKTSSEADARALSGKLADEKFLQIRFAKMLFLCSGQDQLDCSVENCEKCKLKNIVLCEFGDDDKEWLDLETSAKGSEVSHTQFRDLLMQKMLKERLVRWLGYKVHEEGKGPNVLDDKGQGVIHLSAALGYDWAIRLINAAGVNPNFRDLHGRTALHWAAYYGREETVVALVHLGAAPGALEDPTAKFPGGRTAADLASSKGHKGIAGYLAEADLTSHLSSITLRDSALDGVSATLAVDKAVESVEEQSLLLPLDVYKDNQLSLKESLAAVRNSAQAAARIQAAFRVHSFRQRQLAEHNDEGSDSDIYNMVNANMSLKMGSVGIYEIAATSIQKKYRGWKGRRDFVKIRDRVVKIQAHVRGHQVRKQYKKVVWSVGIVEKAILRWRRKGAGLRGFRADATATNKCSSDEKGDEYDFLRAGRKQKVAGLEKALARVQSMVRYPEARDQYMRLVNNFQKTKLGQDPSPDNIVDKSTQGKDSESNLLPMTD